jgi:hypothetical protein
VHGAARRFLPMLRCVGHTIHPCGTSWREATNSCFHLDVTIPTCSPTSHWRLTSRGPASQRRRRQQGALHLMLRWVMNRQGTHRCRRQSLPRLPKPHTRSRHLGALCVPRRGTLPSGAAAASCPPRLRRCKMTTRLLSIYAHSVAPRSAP